MSIFKFKTFADIDEHIQEEKSKIDEMFNQMCGALKNFTLSARNKNDRRSFVIKTQCSFYGSKE